MPELRKLLTKKVLAIPGITEKVWPDRDDGFSSFIYKDKDFAHFHHDHEIDLRLTKKVIAREALIAPQNSEVHPNRAKGSPWIELRFNDEKDVDEVLRLIHLAILHI